MKIMVIDDEQLCIDELSYLLGKYLDMEIAADFTSPLKALEATGNIKPDAVFLDIDMPHLDGLELALRIQALYAGIIIVFITAYAKYALDSFKAYPLDYLLKPVKEARLDATVEHMRRQYALMHPEIGNNSALMRINCFGGFKLSGSGDIKWGTRRVKELFMYLVDRCGAAPTRSELASTVFGGVDDKKTANNIYVTIYKLRSLLDAVDPGRKLIRLREDYALEIAPGICDYIDFMRFARHNAVITPKNAVEAARALSLCQGEYLEEEDYRWSLDSAAAVEAEYERIALGLAGIHSSAGRLREAENVLLELLLKNPLAEEGHTALLDLYIKSGSDMAYRERFHEYARMLRIELREKPSAVYSRHYHAIKKKY